MVVPFGTVMRAELQVTVADDGNGLTTAVDAHPITSWWKEDATWTANTSWSTWTTAGGDYDPAATASVPDAVSVGVQSFDVTGIQP